jgi:phosphatidylglycerophosphate synthase
VARTVPDPTVQADAPDFVLDLLGELRESRFRPEGWARFLGRSWRKSRDTARAHPALVRSWARLAAGVALSEAAVLALEAPQSDKHAVWRIAPRVALGLAWQHFDVYVHLGLNARTRGGPVHERLGPAIALTLGRQAVATILWGHLLGGRPVSHGSALAALLFGSATDMADGAVARRTGRETVLGQYLDGEADLSLWSALALTAAAQRVLPRWLLALLLLRWALPFGVGAASYFGLARRPPLGSTAAGKAAGVAQVALLGAALLPERMMEAIAPWRPVLYAATAAVLVAAPLAQMRRALPRRPAALPEEETS